MSRFLDNKDNSSQMWLFPPSLSEMIPQDCDVRAFKQMMDKLDYRSLINSYSEKGREAYPPHIMSKLLVYAYSNGIRSSREIEKLAKYDVRYMWLCDNFKPDHNTIARFRKDKYQYLTKLFAESIILCDQCGLVSLKCVAVDGSKFESNISKKSIYGEKEIEASRKLAEKILGEAKEADEAEDDTNSDKGNKQKKAEELNSKAERAEENLKSSGKKTTSLSDPESRMMKTQHGKKFCFNIQMAVDVTSGAIVHSSVNNMENDHRQLPGILGDIYEKLGSYPEAVLADTGYCDDVNFGYTRENNINALIPVQKHKSEKENQDNPFYGKNFEHNKERDVLICPGNRELTFTKIRKNVHGSYYREYMITGCGDCEFCAECCKHEPSNRRRVYVGIEHEYREEMKHKMSLDENKELFRKRKQSIEPTFGQIKQNYNLRKFNLRGIAGATSEIMLICIAHNIRKAVCCAVNSLNRRIFAYIRGIYRGYMGKILVSRYSPIKSAHLIYGDYLLE